MLGSQVLEVGIGIILSYMLVCLVLTSTIEVLEGWIKARARGLEVAIAELVHDLRPVDTKNPNRIMGLRERLYRHPLIYPLYLQDYQSRSFDGAAPIAWWRSYQLPTYIPRETFAAALVDLMDPSRVGADLPEAVEESFREAWAALCKVAGNDAAKMRTEVALWYDAAMERAGGRYKRATQNQLFAFGLAIALLFNINSVVIARTLASNQSARDGALLAAAKLSANALSDAQKPRLEEGRKPEVQERANRSEECNDPPPQGPGEETIETENEKGCIVEVKRAPHAKPATEQEASGLPNDAAVAVAVSEAQLPIGWDGTAWEQTKALWNSKNWLMLLAGYLMTALAATLGSPFWFDILGRFINVRAALKPMPKKIR